MTTNNTMPVPSTLDLLIGAYRSHVHGRVLPAPVVVTFHASDAEVAVQPEGALDLVRKLGNVLLWAATLVEVTAEWSHTPDGRLHVSVHGRATSGARFLIYGGGDFAECLGLVPLMKGQRDGVSLDELFTLVCLLREAQHEREVA